jgi:hypothetical protein
LKINNFNSMKTLLYCLEKFHPLTNFVVCALMVTVPGCFHDENSDNGTAEIYYTPVNSIWLVDNSISQLHNFIKAPSKEQLADFYDLFGRVGGSILQGQIGTTKISVAPYKGYYDLKLNVAVPTAGALYKEKMSVKQQNENERAEYEKRKAKFIREAHALYRFDQPLTDIESAVKKAVGKLNMSPDTDMKVLIIHSDMVHDLGKPASCMLNIPPSVNVYVIGRSSGAQVSFNDDACVKYCDSFNEFIHNFKTDLQ